MPATPTAILGIPGPALGDGPADIEAALLPLRNWLDNFLAGNVAGGIASVPLGVQLPYSGLVLPDPTGPVEFAWCDGGLLGPRSTTYAAYFAIVQHAYNNGVDPGSDKFKLPDKRGRAAVGADTFGSAAGPANVLTNDSASTNITPGAKTLGQRAGSDRQILTDLQSGVNRNGSVGGMVPAYGGANPHRHNSTIGGLGFGPFFAGSDGTGGTSANTTDTDVNHYHGFNPRDANNAHSNLQPYELDTWIVRVR